MPNPQWQFTLGSEETDVTSKIEKSKIERALQDLIDVAKLSCVRSINDEDISIGKEFRIYRDSVLVFGGTIQKIVKGEITKINLFEWGGELKRKRATEVYRNKTPEYIVNDLVTNNTKLTANTETSGFTLERWVIDGETLASNIHKLAKLLDWQVRVEPDKNLYFEKKGQHKTSGTLTIGSEIYRLGQWEQQDIDVVNKLTVIGDKVEYNNTETFSGDDNTTTFSLSYKPYGNMLVKIGGTRQTTEDYDIDKEQKQIEFDTAPGSGTDNIEVTYSYKIPIEVKLTGDTSYTNGEVYHKRVEAPFLKTWSDARQYARKYLRERQNPDALKSTDLRIVSFKNLKLGYRIRIVDNYENIDEVFNIYKIKWTYPKEETIISVGFRGDKTIIDWEAETEHRIEQLERELTDRDIIQQYNFGSSTLDVDQRAKRVVVKSRQINDSFILGHPTNSILGTSKLGDRRGNYSIQRAVNYNDTHEETFNRDLFLENVTSGTWHTGSGYLAITSGTVESRPIFKNNEVVNKTTLTETGTGNISYELKAGTNWEGVTSGSEHTFTDTGSVLKWRGIGTGTVQKITIEYTSSIGETPGDPPGFW